MMRGIEPGTGTSRAHRSGTRCRPSRRAATAGNSASRSAVSVKMQLTMSCECRPLRAISSRISSPVAVRIDSASLASTLLAPRSANSRIGRGLCQRAALGQWAARCHRGVELVHGRAAEAMYGDHQRAERARQFRGLLAVGEQELRPGRTHERLGLYRGEAALEKRLSLVDAREAVGLRPQAVSDEDPPA